MTEFKTLKLRKGMIDAMVEAGLDPKEFYTFMQKYGDFIDLGLTVKKLDAINSAEYDEINKSQALSGGVRCFHSLLADFQKEYESKALKRK